VRAGKATLPFIANLKKVGENDERSGGQRVNNGAPSVPLMTQTNRRASFGEKKKTPKPIMTLVRQNGVFCNFR